MMVEIKPGRTSVPEGAQYLGLRVKSGVIHVCQGVEDWRSKLLAGAEARKFARQSAREEVRRERLEAEIDKARREAGVFIEEAPQLLEQAQERWAHLPEEVSETGDKIVFGATQLGKWGGETFSEVMKIIWKVGSWVGQRIRAAGKDLVKLLKNLRSKKNE